MSRTAPSPSAPRPGLARRAVALVALVLLLAAVPLLVLRLIGLPDGESFSGEALSRLDERTVVHLGVVVFFVLWAWFTATAIAEALVVIRWKSACRRSAAAVAPLPPLQATPGSLVRKLVRLALVSATVVGTSAAHQLGGAAAAAGRSTATAPVDMPSTTGARAGSMAGPSASELPGVDRQIVADGRATPYSLAVHLGDAALREPIIAANRGRPTPDGNTWAGGVFPEGMVVVVPANLHDDLTATPSWGLHTVEPGASYWSIAEEVLAADDTSAPTPAEVLAATEALRDLNAPRFGRSDPNLIHPGDVLIVPFVTDGLDTPSGAADQFAIGDLHDARPTVPIIEEPPLPMSPTDTATSVDTPVSIDPPAPTDSLPVDETTPAVTAPAVTAPLPITPSENVPVSTGPDEADTREARPPLTTSLGAALLLCAGALGLLETRRRHQLRSAPNGAVVLAPTIAAATTERLLRSLDGIQRAARLDLMLRCLGRYLVGSGHHVVAVLIGDDGAFDAVLDAPSGVVPPPPFRRVDARRWSLPAEIDTLDLSDDARLAGQPCPALVQVGTARDALTGAPLGELLVDLEAVGLLAIDGPGDEVERILLGIATSLAASPVGETLRLITHGIDPAVHLGNLNAESADRFDEALDAAVRTLGSTAAATVQGRQRTFELRARGSGGEAWEPVVVVSSPEDGLDDDDRREVLALTRSGGRGLAVVIGTAVPGAELTLHATNSGWLVERLGMMVVPVGLEPAQVQVVHDLLDAAERPLPAHGHGLATLMGSDHPENRADGHDTSEAVFEPDTAASPAPAPAPAPISFEEPQWAVMVRLLGPVEVISPDGSPIAFERGKSLELVAWLSTHRERPTRLGARTALWELDVRDATFANVVSDARRALARAVRPADGEDWIVRTLSDALPLHDLVRSDAELLRCRVQAARHLPATEAIDVLRPGVALVRGLPFEGTGYLWPDAEGTTSELIVLATGAALELAQHALTVGDIDTVFWATSQGLRVLPGHEELVALRMRAYALHGDLAGVRMEWEIYERTVHSDPWSFGEPSPKLVAIRRQLLSS